MENIKNSTDFEFKIQHLYELLGIENEDLRKECIRKAMFDRPVESQRIYQIKVGAYTD